MYSVLLEFQPTHTHRWRFLNGEWQASSTIADPPEQQPGLYVHPSSPASGLQWMKDPVSFAKLKLSNKENGNGKVHHSFQVTIFSHYQTIILTRKINITVCKKKTFN